MFFVRTLFLSLMLAFFAALPFAAQAQQVPAEYSTCLQRAWANVPSGTDRATYTEGIRSRVNEVSTRLGETASPGNWQCRRLCTQTPTETGSCVTGGCPNDDRTVLCCPATIGSAPSNRCPLTPTGSAQPTAPSTANTAGTPTFSFQLPACTETGNCSLTDLINVGVRAANFLMGLGGVLFFFVFVYAGGRLIFFANDAGEVKNMKKRLTDASTGIVIMILAGAIVRFVSSALLPGGSAVSTGASSSATGAARTRLSGAAATRISRPPSTGAVGRCVCQPSGLAGALSSQIPEQYRTQAQGICEGDPINGRFDARAFSCSAEATSEECDRAETGLNEAAASANLPIRVTADCTWSAIN